MIFFPFLLYCFLLRQKHKGKSWSQRTWGCVLKMVKSHRQQILLISLWAYRFTVLRGARCRKWAHYCSSTPTASSFPPTTKPTLPTTTSPPQPPVLVSQDAPLLSPQLSSSLVQLHFFTKPHTQHALLFYTSLLQQHHWWEDFFARLLHIAYCGF